MTGPSLHPPSSHRKEGMNWSKGWKWSSPVHPLFLFHDSPPLSKGHPPSSLSCDVFVRVSFEHPRLLFSRWVNRLAWGPGNNRFSFFLSGSGTTNPKQIHRDPFRLLRLISSSENLLKSLTANPSSHAKAMPEMQRLGQNSSVAAQGVGSFLPRQLSLKEGFPKK